jgi:hypothetical protein
MSHGEFEELAAGYVLGALEPDDEHAFQQHLDGCPTCRALVRELEAVAAQLAYAAPPAEPPDTVWAAIRREIGADAVDEAVRGPVGGARATFGTTPGGPGTTPAGPTTPARPGPRADRRPGPGRSRLLAGLGAAAAVLLVVALSAWNLNLRQQNDAYRQRVAALERAAELVNEPTANLIALDDTPGPAGAQATVVASTRLDRAVLVVENLPPLRRGRVYALWCVPGSNIKKAEKAMVFVPLRRQGAQTLGFQVPIQPGTAFAITDEPGPAGSDKPSTDPLLAGAPTTA